MLKYKRYKVTYKRLKKYNKEWYGVLEKIFEWQINSEWLQWLVKLIKKAGIQYPSKFVSWCYGNNLEEKNMFLHDWERRIALSKICDYPIDSDIKEDWACVIVLYYNISICTHVCWYIIIEKCK